MSQNKSIKLPIKGMHCRSCEILIEDNLKAVSHVKSVNLNYKTGLSTIHYEGQAPNIHDLKKAIMEAGYEISESEKLPFISQDKNEYTSLGVAFLFVMIAYFVFKGLGISNINLTPSLGSPSWGIIILIGLVAGISTCMALVGGLSLGLSAKFVESHPEATAAEKFSPHIFFNIGRILIYTLLGGLLGALGTVFQLSPTVNGILTIIVGLVMLVMGLQLINIFPRLNNFKVMLPKGISRALGLNHKSEEYSHQQAMILGGLTFFLPCGFTQAMQLYAISTGDFGYGALTMGLFALGTAPGLLSIGGVTALVKGKVKEKFFKGAGIAVILFAIFNLNSGYTLAGFDFGFSKFGRPSAEALSDPNVSLEDGVQVVRMVENSKGYSPNKFAIEKGVPVRWEIDAQAVYSCASSLVVSKLDIRKTLESGINIIEFTPEEVGRIPFSCSMGMYSGEFNVYDKSSIVQGAADSQDNTAVNSAVKTGGGTCGSGGACGCGGGAKKPIDTNAKPVAASVDNSGGENVQIIKATYTEAKYLSPSSFKVKAGTKVRLELDVRDNGVGCGYAIMIPGLYNVSQPLKAGAPLVMEFTPTKPGSYDITCSMNMITYGSIIVE